MFEAFVSSMPYRSLTSCTVAAAGQATFSVRATSAGVASYTAKTPTASVGLEIDYATVHYSQMPCCTFQRSHARVG